MVSSLFIIIFDCSSNMTEQQSSKTLTYSFGLPLCHIYLFDSTAMSTFIL